MSKWQQPGIGILLYTVLTLWMSQEEVSFDMLYNAISNIPCMPATGTVLSDLLISASECFERKEGSNDTILADSFRNTVQPSASLISWHSDIWSKEWSSQQIRYPMVVMCRDYSKLWVSSFKLSKSDATVYWQPPNKLFHSMIISTTLWVTWDRVLLLQNWHHANALRDSPRHEFPMCIEWQHDCCFPYKEVQDGKSRTLSMTTRDRNGL